MYKRKDGRYVSKITIIEDGIHKVKCVYGKSRQEVNKKLREIELVQEHGMKFTELADRWFADHEKRTTYNGHVAYNKPLRECKEWFDCRFVGDITTEDVQKYINEIAKCGYAKRTVEMYRGCIDMIYKFGIQQGYVTNNPVTVSKIPDGLRKSKRDIPSTDAIEKIKAYDEWLMPKFLLYTGLRRGEALAITDKDIDRKNHKIYVTKSVYFAHNRGLIKQPKTECGIRAVPLLDVLEIPKFKGYLFGEDEPLSEQTFRRAWERFQKATDLDITPHQLRHLYATILFESGVDEFYTTKIMGHSSIQVTRDIYTHLREQKLDEVTTRLNQLVI